MEFSPRLWLIVLVLLLASCEPEATPLPVEIAPAPSATPTPDARRIRYGVQASAAAYLDLAALQETAQVETLNAPPDPALLGAQYDVLVALADFAGGVRAPNAIRVGVLLNPAAPPLDDPAVAGIAARALAGEAGEGLRVELANAGYPDGFDLAGEALVPPGTALEALRGAGIGVRLAEPAPPDAEARFEAGRLHLLFVRWTDDAGRAGWAARGTLIDLYALPVVYRVSPDIAVTGFTPDGLPLGRRG